jgi:phage terminase small subunit
MGRPRTPTADKMAAGTMRKDRIPPAIPQHPLGADVPRGMTGGARRKWLELAPLLVEARAMTVINREQLEMTCLAYGQYAEANAALRRKGVRLTYSTLTSSGSEMARPRAEVAIRAEAWKRYMTGLTALRRAFESAPPTSKEDPMLEILDGGRRSAAG